jgi:hypothetical protein
MKEPDDHLEMSLIKATNDPSQRSQFYRDLLDSELFFIIPIDETQKIGKRVIEQGTTMQFVSFENDGINWIPAFTSLVRLQQFLTKESRFLKLKAKDFFEFALGAFVVLNPNTTYKKELTPEEITKILDGSIFRNYHEINITKETKILFGAPSVYPTILVQGLKKVFVKNRHVLRAYLTLSQIPEFDEKPHYLIGIDVDGGWEEVLNNVSEATSKLIGKDDFVDFVQINQSDATEFLVNETKPFYKKFQIKRLFG